MKTRTILLVSITTLLLLLTSVAGVAQTRQKKARNNTTTRNSNTENIRLFNGKDLSGWVFYLKDNSVDPESVFTVNKGVINIKGSPFGYMRTKSSYSDYRLHLEYRWPEEATNSGVFIHAQTPDTIWLKTIECQLAAGNAGDFICMKGTDMNERTDKSTIVIKKMNPSSEKSVGEWNTMEVVCNASTIEVYVNGVLQNSGTGVSVSSGHICLQSEGKNIEFRNLFLKKLKNSGSR